MTPEAHLLIISRALQVLRELLEIPRDQWDDYTAMRALAQMSAIHTSAVALKDYCKTKDFVLNAVASASIGESLKDPE